MLASFLNYQTWVYENYGITINDCEMENITPKLDIVETYALTIFIIDEDCTCQQEQTIPQYVLDAIYKGTYYLDNINTSDIANIDKWQEIVFNHLKNNGGIIVF